MRRLHDLEGQVREQHALQHAGWQTVSRRLVDAEILLPRFHQSGRFGSKGWAVRQLDGDVGQEIRLLVSTPHAGEIWLAVCSPWGRRGKVRLAFTGSVQPRRRARG